MSGATNGEQKQAGAGEAPWEPRVVFIAGCAGNGLLRRLDCVRGSVLFLLCGFVSMWGG